jgi:hypothetical protein
MNKFDKFLELMVDKGEEHRKIAKKFKIKSVIESNRHDGMADMANVLSIEYELKFKKELDDNFEDYA